jgi:capsular exopolysaccharide synthesis family protein
LQTTAQSGTQLDANLESTAQLEDDVKRLAAEEAHLRIEIQEAPKRYQVFEDAVVLRTSNDRRLIMASAGAAAGAFALVLLAFAFWEFRARRIGTVEEVVHGLGMNLMGTLPNTAAKAYGVRTRSGEDATHGLLAEAVDATRTMLLRAARTESLRVVMVTSAHGGEGKTSLSTHLAASLAQVGYRTLLIDGDLRNPIAHRVLGIDLAPGFCELLRGDAEVTDVIRSTSMDRLSMLPAGEWDSQASRALAREGFLQSILGRFRQEYDFIVIDTSPVLPVVDPLLIGQQADGAILSVLRDVSRMPSVYSAHQRLTASGVRVLGAVISGVRGEDYGTYSYQSGSGAYAGTAIGQPSQDGNRNDPS